MISRVFVVLASLCSFARAEEQNATAVFDLTNENFFETVGGDKPVFVKFYAPWCGHCKRLAPDWEKLAEAANEKEDACLVADLDATVHRAVGEKMKVRGYPTLILFGKDNMYEYDGNRKLEDLQEFCFGGYTKGTPKNLPWNETFLDKAKDSIEEYVRKVGQIVAFEPTILPLMFFLGVFSTVLVYFCVQATSRKPSATKAEKTENKASPVKKAQKAE